MVRVCAVLRSACASAFVVVGAAGVLVASADRQTQIPDPVQKELNEARARAMSDIRALNAQLDRLVEAIQPFGPLDLTVSRPPAGVPVRTLRHSFHGYVSGFSSVGFAGDLETRKRVTCGAACYKADIERAKASGAPILRRLSDLVRGLRGAAVLAIWPAGACRIGNAVVQGDTVQELVGSPLIGAVPWERRPFGTRASLLRERGLSPGALSQALADMRALDIRAIAVESPSSTRIILAGSVGTFEAGFLISDKGAAVPRVGTKTDDGREYVSVEPVAAGVHFYTTK